MPHAWIRCLFMRWLLLLLLASSPVTHAGSQASLRQAEQLRKQGWPLVAANLFEEVLSSKPNSGRARIGLAGSLVAVGRYDEALALVEGLRQRRSWGAEAAMVEAEALMRLGRLSEARAAYEEAAWFEPSRTQAVVGIALAAAALGDLEAAEEALEELVVMPRGVMYSAATQVRIALEQGLPSFEADLASLERVQERLYAPQRGILDAIRWLDLDDPFAADQVLREVIGKNLQDVQVATWRAETLRRLGDPTAAAGALNRPAVRDQAHTPLANAVRVRILVDQGDLPGARELLGHLTHPADAEAVASRWYLARALGDEAEAARLAETWRLLVSARDRKLEQLIPLHDRESP